MRRLPAALAILLVSTEAVAATPPFVGCPADGQMGPMSAPAGRAPDLPLPPATAARLAWYAGNKDEAVLGPVGWHCIKLYGSNGWILFVTPVAVDVGALTRGLPGPAIQLGLSDGGTSGRFEVAALAAGLFPQEAAFVARVEAEHLLPPSFFTSRVARTDRLERRGADVVLFETPASTAGLGTASRLVPDTAPIDGAVILRPGGDVSLVHLSVRLPPVLAHLAPAIVGDAVGRYASH